MFKILQKSLLPRGLQRGGALNLEDLKIKLRLTLRLAKGLKRLKNIRQKYFILGFITLFLMGYQPVIQFPPVKQSLSFAAENQIQSIEAEIFPQLQLPHPGYLSTKFSRFHPGVDIATGLGMPIHPVTEGEIMEVNFGLWGYGNHVIVSHMQGLKSLYGHMGRVYVKRGQIVSVNDSLGTVGMTGFTSGPHTHLEIYREGKTIDPLTILPSLQDYPAEEYLKPYGGAPTGEHEKLSKTLKPDFR